MGFRWHATSEPAFEETNVDSVGDGTWTPIQGNLYAVQVDQGSYRVYVFRGSQAPISPLQNCEAYFDVESNVVSEAVHAL